MSSGDVSWVLISAALVMLMVPGVGLFYSGLVRKKNAIAAITLTFVALAVVAIQWVVIGYSISFGQSLGGIIGSLDHVGLRGVAASVANLPASAYIVFQLMFAAVTMAILTSAMAERIKLSSFVAFSAIWVTLVYCPMAHWVWGGGWLASIGALDFAGGTVVHICSGFSALAMALVIGKRKGFGVHSIEPHNIPLTLLGVALLWFGWLGFNGGSALAANATAANALLVTSLSAAAGALSWMAISWAKGMPGSLSVASGAIAGLVAITPAAGYVDPLSSIAIGAVAGLVCFYALGFRMRRGLDESLDAWAIHGVGGVWGALATGIFATLAVGSYSGLLYGNVAQFGAQALAVAVSIAYSFCATYVLAKLIDRAMGLRVGDQEEYVGLDLAQLGERAYS